MGESIGMMEGAYFVGRVELLNWINGLTGFGYTKIEQCASGAATCHVFDALYPGSVRLEKVNFTARREYEYIHNYKVLQAAFNRLNISKQIEVEKLIRGKYQDNLEFMQWVKGYFDSHANEDAVNYDGAERRQQLGKGASAAGRRPVRTPGTAASRTTQLGAQGRVSAAASPGPPRARRVPQASIAKENRAIHAIPTEPMVKKSELDEMRKNVEDMERLLQEGDNEREFYFGKLQQIESIVRELEDKYSTEELDPLLVEFCELIKATLYEQEDGTGNEGEAQIPAEGDEPPLTPQQDAGSAEPTLDEEAEREEALTREAMAPLDAEEAADAAYGASVNNEDISDADLGLNQLSLGGKMRSVTSS